MSFTNSVSIRLGRLSGVAYWDSARQTYAALLRLFADGNGYPPSWARYGVRRGEFLTPDALVNYLGAVGLEADDASLMALQWLRRHVAEIEGEPEIVGFVDHTGARRLWLATPSRSLLAVNPRIDHDEYALSWGDTSPATVETARLICEHAFVRRPSQDVETFALTLTYEYLSSVEGDFSIDANALCDWFLTDSELTTTLSPRELNALRAHAGFNSPRLRLAIEPWQPAA